MYFSHDKYQAIEWVMLGNIGQYWVRLGNEEALLSGELVKKPRTDDFSRRGEPSHLTAEVVSTAPKKQPVIPNPDSESVASWQDVKQELQYKMVLKPNRFRLGSAKMRNDDSFLFLFVN